MSNDGEALGTRGGGKLGSKGDGAGLQHGDGFAAGGNEIDDIGGPGVDRRSFNIIPAAPFPGAKVNFAQALVAEGSGVERLRQPACPAQGAADDRGGGWQLGAQAISIRLRGDAVDVEVAVADTRLDQRRGVTDQENLHSRPA